MTKAKGSEQAELQPGQQQPLPPPPQPPREPPRAELAMLSKIPVLQQTPEEITAACMAHWGGLANVPQTEMAAFIAVAVAYGLNPLLGEIVLLKYTAPSGKVTFNVYPTVKGTMKKLAVDGVMDGFSTGEPVWHDRMGGWGVHAVIWLKGCSHAFEGWGYASSSNSKISQLWDHAATRALGRIARNICGMSLPTAEEMVGEGGYTYVSAHSEPAAPATETRTQSTAQPVDAEFTTMPGTEEKQNASQPAGQAAAPKPPPTSLIPPPGEMPPEVTDSLQSGTNVYFADKAMILLTRNKDPYVLFSLLHRGGACKASMFKLWQAALAACGVSEAQIMAAREKDEIEIGCYVRADIQLSGDYVNLQYIEKWTPASAKQEPPAQRQDDLLPPIDDEPKQDLPFTPRCASTEKVSRVLYEVRRINGHATWLETWERLRSTAIRTLRAEGIADAHLAALPVRVIDSWMDQMKERDTASVWGGKPSFTPAEAYQWMVDYPEWADGAPDLPTYKGTRPLNEPLSPGD